MGKRLNHIRSAPTIKRLAAQGLTDTQIAEKFGVNSPVILAIRKRYKIKSPYEKMKDEMRQKIAELIKDGLTNTQISKQLGCSEKFPRSERKKMIEV